ncbi:hypothetical protein JCM8202_005467 [Rhodotorula sphaerocarpa]
MVLARVCTACVRTSRLLARPAPALAPVQPGPRAFSAAAPALKKAGRSAQAFEEEDDFVEDEFEDDVDAVVEDLTAHAAQRGAQGADKRAAIYEQALAAALKAVNAPARQLRYRPAPESTVAALVQAAGPQDLPRVVEVLQQWRQKDLPAPKGPTVQHLLKRFAESDRPQDAVDLLAARDRFRLNLPSNLSATYPLFHALSRPTPVVAAEAAAVTDAAEPAAPADSPATSPIAPPSSEAAFVLYDLLRLYHPEAAAGDSFVLLTTLAAALRNGEANTARVQAVLSQLQALGEDRVVEQVRSGLSKRWQATMRMRARAIAYAMRDLDHAEFEWFAHLSETLQKVTARA